MPIRSSLLDMPKIHIAAGLAPIDAPTRWLSLSKTPWQPRPATMPPNIQAYWTYNHHGGTNDTHRYAEQRTPHTVCYPDRKF